MNLTLLAARAACALLMFGAAMNAEVVATVSSSEPFSLRGNVVPIQGVNTWPVFNGDEIATGPASAIVSFRDGSRILLDRNTRIMIVFQAKKTNVKVAKGKVWYDLKGAANFTLGTFEKVVSPRAAQTGSLAVTDSGDASVAANDTMLQQLQMQAIYLPRATQVPNIYPVSIQYGSTPSGVSTVPGPTPTSSATPAP